MGKISDRLGEETIIGQIKEQELKECYFKHKDIGGLSFNPHISFVR